MAPFLLLLRGFEYNNRFKPCSRNHNRSQPEPVKWVCSVPRRAPRDRPPPSRTGSRILPALLCPAVRPFAGGTLPLSLRGSRAPCARLYLSFKFKVSSTQTPPFSQETRVLPTPTPLPPIPALPCVTSTPAPSPALMNPAPGQALPAVHSRKHVPSGGLCCARWGRGFTLYIPRPFVLGRPCWPGLRWALPLSPSSPCPPRARPPRQRCPCQTSRPSPPAPPELRPQLSSS